jgi:hypothetical protein
MNSRIGACLLMIGLVCAEAVAQEAASATKLQSALLAQEKLLIEAIKTKDKPLMAELLAEEAISITSRGRQSTREIVDSLEQVSFSDYKISDPKAFAVTRDVAILSYLFSWTGSSAGEAPTTTTVYASSVWRMRDGKWRSVLYQETPMTK